MLFAGTVRIILSNIINILWRYLYSHHNSLVGRDYKVWAQVGIFIVWPLLTQNEKNVWLSLAKVRLIYMAQLMRLIYMAHNHIKQVFQIAYCKPFTSDDFSMITATGENFIQSVNEYRSALLNRVKFHLLLHLPQNILDFGSTSSFNTERYSPIWAQYRQSC